MPPAEPGASTVVCADEQAFVEIDLDRWGRLAQSVLETEQLNGELTLTFIDIDEMTELNQEHMGAAGATDVLSFPLDEDEDEDEDDGVPRLIGDVVICPQVAVSAAGTHAGTLDDELALLVVHGILHIAGHDHAEPDQTQVMRARELELLERHHWGGPAPAGFSQVHLDET